MVEITLGGKAREMRFSYKSMRTLEAYFKQPINKIMKQTETLESLEALSAFYYACLKPKDKSLTFEKVEDLLDEALDSGEVSITDLSDKLKETIENAQIIKSLNESNGEGDAKN